MRAEGWDDACVCGMKFGDGSCCLLAKSEAFLFRDSFFDLCCFWWVLTVQMRPGAAQPSLSQRDHKLVLSTFSEQAH